MPRLQDILAQHAGKFAAVVPYDRAADKLLLLNFTASNTALTDEVLNDTEKFSQYVNEQLGVEYRYGVGGYNEHRTVYSRSTVFDTTDEPRRLHLGVDIWGPAGVPVFAPLDGRVHSFAFNDHYGDYGATIILEHTLDGATFYSLYGHLAQRDLEGLHEGKEIKQGEEFCHFGEPVENGYWPPHLHFQLIENMGEWRGDYPGVCKFSERETYLANGPDPDIILGMVQNAIQE
ncbi:peptidoglycan DD-metalloendopeptidase family protein [Aridibaculum aurantiacum]|uniref:peptidoglycan DD-metalloendopeptidase family protein n=1 Tax=Aridibaculum aurantiacum TaxID=2810307 RepID=UPI001A95DD95|nr:peptidoglycan DD-metalloendopeptidase family protein [Aridibaculum aurantiacum]